MPDPFAPPAPVSPTKPLTGRELIISQYKHPSLMTEEEVKKELRGINAMPFNSFKESVRRDQINKYLKTQQWDEASDLRREGEAQRQSDIAIRELGNKQIDAIESTFRQANPDSALSRDQVKDSYIKEYGKDYLSQLGYSPVWGEEDKRKRLDQAEELAGELSDPRELAIQPGWLERRESDIGKAWNQTEIAWNSLGALAFDKIGADDWAKSWAEDAAYDQAEAAEYAKTGLQFGAEDIESAGDAFEWVTGSLAELAPMIGEVAAQAAIGSLLATPGAGTVAGATSGIVFRQASRKALAEATGKILAKREALTAGTRGSLQTFLKTGNYDHLTDDALRALGDDASLAAGTVRGAEKEAIKDRLKGLGLKLESDSAQALFGHHYTVQRKVWGSTAGSLSATIPLETGGALSDYAQQMGIPANEIDLWTGLKIGAAGTVAGAADAIFPFMIANRVFARPVKSAILQSKWQKAKPFLQKAIMGSGVEGGTEVFQESVTTAAVREAKGLDAWDFTDEEWSHVREAGYKGALGGLFFPAVINTSRRLLKWSGSKMGMTEGESVAATPSEVLSGALATQDSKVDEMLDPEHIVPSPAASTESTESSELLDEGDSIPVSVAREPSHEQKLAIKQLVIKEASETITEEAAAEERARLLTDQADKDFYKKTSTEVVSALAHKRKGEVEALALRAAQSNNLSEEENAALDDEVAKLSTTDKALFNKVRLDLLNRKARGEQNMDGMTKEDLLYENAPIKERREFLAAVGQRIANEPKKSLDELRADAKTKLEKDLIDLIIEFESSDQTTTEEYMDLVLPGVASSPMQEGLAQYVWTAHTEEAAEHMVRMENASEESKVNTGSEKAWADHIAGVLEKWVARAVDEVTPADIKLWQLDPRNRDSLTEPEAQALNTAQARLISEEGQTEETLTAAQVVRKANEILALERKQAAAVNETVAADNPTVNKAIDKVKKAPKAKKAKKPAAPEADKGRLDTEEATEETVEETVEGAVTKKAKKKARDEAVDREIEAALEATDDAHKRIEHLFRARQIVKRAGGRLTRLQKDAIEGMEKGLKAEGYTWESLDGEEIHDGDAINPTYIPENSKAGARLAHLRKHDGEHGVVSETLTPEIRKDGKMSKVADVKVVEFGEITYVESLQRRIDSLTEKIERPSRPWNDKANAGLTESRDALQKELDAAEKPVEGVTTKSDLLKRFVDGVKHSGRTLSPSDQASLKDMVESGEVTAKELEASIDQLEEAMEAEMAEVVGDKPVEEEVVAEEDKIPTLYYGTTNQEITDTVSVDLDNIVSEGRGTGFQAEGAGRYATTAREAGEWYQRGEEEKGRKGAKEGLLYEYDSNISESSVLNQSAKGIENQPEAVQKAWQAYLDLLNQDPKGNKKRLGKIKKLSADWSGYHFYGEITDYFVKTKGKSSKVGSSSKEDIYMAQVKASRFLRDNGVDAMSYSRKGKGTASNKTYKNYVILNTDKVTVKKVYDHEGNVVHDASTAEVAVEEKVVAEAPALTEKELESERLIKQTILKNLEEGKYNADVLPDEISQEARKSSEGRTILSAISVARGSHGAIQEVDAPAKEGRAQGAYANREAIKIGRKLMPLEGEVLAEWAEQEGLLGSSDDMSHFLQHAKDKHGEYMGGGETIVSFDEKTQRWTKINTLSHHDTHLDFLYRLAIHNYLFPDVAYRLEGFVWTTADYYGDAVLPFTSKGKGSLRPIVSQPHVKQAGKRVTTEEAEKELKEMGGESAGGTADFRIGDILIDDISGGLGNQANVLRDADGNLHFIDTHLELDRSSKTKRLREFVGEGTQQAKTTEGEGGFVLDDSPQQKNLEMRREELKEIEEKLESKEKKQEDARAELAAAEREHEKLERKAERQPSRAKRGEPLGAAANTHWSKDPANAVSAGRASGVAMKVHELSGAKSTQQIKETPGHYKGKGYAPATKGLVDPPQGKHFGIKALVYELLRIEGAAAPSEVVMLSELDDKGGIQLEIDGVAGIELTVEKLSGEGMTVRLQKIWSIERGGALKAGKKLVAAANASGVTIVGTANPFTNPKTEKIEMTEERLIKFYEKMGATVDENGNAIIKPDYKKGERAATKRLKDAVKANQEYINETQDEVSEAEDNVDKLEDEKAQVEVEIEALEMAPEGAQQAKTVGQLAEFPGGLDTTKPVSGTHKSINLESVEEGFEVRVSKGVPVGVSIARIPGEELSSPTLAEPTGTAGIVDVIVRGKGLDYETESGKKLVDDLHRKSEEASEASMKAGAEP